ncbi:MAG: glyoxalase superfamily protein [Geminicoccaceae bacterium]
MNGSPPRLPSIEALKDQARRLRATRGSGLEPITHSRSLELLAHQYGYKDWNTLHWAVGNAPPSCPAALGAKVHGRYLGQAFEGEVIGVQTLTPRDRFRVTLHFDEPVDVVTFDSFSNMRQRVTCVIDSSGKSTEKTSDGRPHMQLEV